MPLPQDITPVSAQIMDTLVKASETDWIETAPGMSWVKVLWTGAESGTWAVLRRSKKGFVTPTHKHLSPCHTFMLQGQLSVRDGTLDAGDYLYEANGMVHEATTALADSEYLFICEGTMLMYDDIGFTSYFSWEEVVRMQRAEAQRKKSAG